MKNVFLILLVLTCITSFAQQENDAIKKCIRQFFDGMKANDTAYIKSSLDSSCFLYTIMQTKDGRTLLEEETVSAFFREVVELKGNTADEQL